MKFCEKHQLEKILSPHGKNPSGSPKFQFVCQKCVSDRGIRWRKMNHERSLERAREWRRNNKDKIQGHRANRARRAAEIRRELGDSYIIQSLRDSGIPKNEITQEAIEAKRNQIKAWRARKIFQMAKVSDGLKNIHRKCVWCGVDFIPGMHRNIICKQCKTSGKKGHPSKRYQPRDKARRKANYGERRDFVVFLIAIANPGLLEKLERAETVKKQNARAAAIAWRTRNRDRVRQTNKEWNRRHRAGGPKKVTLHDVAEYLGCCYRTAVRLKSIKSPRLNEAVIDLCK